jgi:hypothetical protein
LRVTIRDVLLFWVREVEDEDLIWYHVQPHHLFAMSGYS